MLIDDEPDYSFTVGDWEEIRALDVAVQLMGVGEKVLLQVPFAAEFEITLLEVTDAPDLTLLPPTEKTDLATCKREQGNVLDQHRDYDYTTHKHDTALQTTESISKDDICSEKENELMEVKVKCLNNMAASMLELDHNDEALQSCSAALTDQPDNVKEHFHMDKELALQDKYSEASQTPREALELEPRNNEIHDEVSTMIKKHSEDSEDDEKMLENPSSTHKHQAKSAWGLSWKWLLGATAVAIGGIALSVVIYARK
uniref:PPIase FKBP-type domain-containing protein n=1 Tax=Gouania willdenowi TaxID=441366 RepID=A0A8C5EKF2_GOUWI